MIMMVSIKNKKIFKSRGEQAIQIFMQENLVTLTRMHKNVKLSVIPSTSLLVIFAFVLKQATAFGMLTVEEVLSLFFNW